MKPTILVLLIGSAFIANAQSTSSKAALPLPADTKLYTSSDIQGGIRPGNDHQKTISVFAGTQGLGADFRYEALPRLSLRIGAAITPINLPDAIQMKNINSSLGVDVNFINTHLLADYEPFSGSGVRVVAGVGYFIKANTTADIQSSGEQYGNIQLTSNQLGDMHITSDWKGFAPYAGLGFIHTFPRNFFNINIDLGTYYLSAPKTNIVATGALKPNEDNNNQLQQNISNYRWLPVLQLNFNFKL